MRCEILTKCIDCGACTAVCPMECIMENAGEEIMEIDQERCIGCGQCADLCPIGAIAKK